MKRRDFIKTAGAVPMMSYFPADLSRILREKSSGSLEKRALGKTGEKLTIVGFGGIMVNGATAEQAARNVRTAIEGGINYFDVAPTYGNAEEMLGPALEPYRKDVFLACKTTERKKEGARKELENSLKLLRTDHFDLYQLHAMTKVEDVDTVLGRGGAMETYLEAQKEGKIRFIGFSAHSVEASMALMDRFDFDTILFPINFATWHAGNFGPQVLAKAQEKGMGILALKAMARRPYPENYTKEKIPNVWYEPLMDPKEAEMGLRFTLSHPVTAAIPPGSPDLFEMGLKFAQRFKPLSKAESSKMKDLAMETTPIFKYPMG